MKTALPNRSDLPDDTSPEQAEADAMLMAAAPDLLAALKEMLFTAWALENPDQSIVRQARAAVRKATGS